MLHPIGRHDRDEKAATKQNASRGFAFAVTVTHVILCNFCERGPWNRLLLCAQQKITPIIAKFLVVEATAIES